MILRGLVAVTLLVGLLVGLTPARPAEMSQGETQAKTAPNAASAQGGTPPAGSHGLHYVTMTFDYDFSKTPACSATVQTKCVQEFVAYDISAGVKNRTKLFEIPLPANPVGLVHGITQKSPTKLDFQSGRHLLAVVAREPDGSESRHVACMTWIRIP